MELVKEVYEVGPRKITRVGNNAGVYLGRDMMKLIGRKALITIKIIE